MYFQGIQLEKFFLGQEYHGIAHHLQFGMVEGIIVETVVTFVLRPFEKPFQQAQFLGYCTVPQPQGVGEKIDIVVQTAFIEMAVEQMSLVFDQMSASLCLVKT